MRDIITQNTPPRLNIQISNRGSTNNTNNIHLILKKYTGRLGAPKVYSKDRYKKIYRLGMLDIGVLIVPLETKKQKKTKPPEFISIIKFYISTNKVKKLYLRLLFIILLL